MNKVTWAIQTNLISDFSIKTVWYAAMENGCNVQEVVVIPFQDEFGNEEELQSMLVDGVVIPYGSCKLTRISNERAWNGNCFDPDTFRSDIWLTKHNDMLNTNSHFMKVKDTAEFFKDTDEMDEWFIRPVKDLKQFNGTVAEVGDIKNWMHSTKSGNFSFGEDTEIMLAPVQKLYSEARFFIVSGKVIDGSYYRMGGRLHSNHINQQETLDAAQELANKWLPHECCVMDVADTDDGLKVIEFNSWNSSGFYDHDIPKLVKTMTDWARYLPIND